MLRIVMDGGGDLPAGWKEAYDIEIVPINIQFGQQSFLQGIDLSNSDFYRLVSQNGRIPQTSQPSPQQFINFYRRISQPGDTILSIHVTSGLSGTFHSAQIAAREISDEYCVVPFDSASGSAAMGFMCREARELERSGAGLEAILKRLDFIRRNVSIVLTLDTLEYAWKSGRVKALQAALASLLSVKPVIALRSGVLDMAGKVRTRRRAMNSLIADMRQRVGDRLVNVAVVHAEDPDAGRSLLAQARAAFNCAELVLTELSISVAANLGPGTVGIVAYPVQEG